jgi:hypothetical protein
VVTIPVKKDDGLNGIVLQKFATNKPAGAPIVVSLSGKISKTVADDAAKTVDATDEKPVKKPVKKAVKKVEANPAAADANRQRRRLPPSDSWGVLPFPFLIARQRRYK